MQEGFVDSVELYFATNAMDDLSNDAEASDIISQEEISVGISGSRANNKDDKNTVGPEWSDPWSSDPWKNTVWAEPSANNQSRIESSFESLQFTPVIRTAGENNELFDFADAFGTPFGPTDTPATPKKDPIQNPSTPSPKRAVSTIPSPKIVVETKINLGVVVKERLSIFFDEATNDPACKVVGSIYVKPTKRRINSFALTIRDSRNHVENWDERNSRCRNITAAVPHLALDSGDQVLSISLNRNDQHSLGLDAPVVNYTCVPRLRPMPMVRNFSDRIVHTLSNIQHLTSLWIAIAIAICYVSILFYGYSVFIDDPNSWSKQSATKKAIGVDLGCA